MPGLYDTQADRSEMHDLGEAEDDLKTTIVDAVNDLHTLVDHAVMIRPKRILGISTDKWGWPGTCLAPACAMLSAFLAIWVLSTTNAKHAGTPSFAVTFAHGKTRPARQKIGRMPRTSNIGTRSAPCRDPATRRSDAQATEPF